MQVRPSLPHTVSPPPPPPRLSIPHLICRLSALPHARFGRCDENCGLDGPEHSVRSRSRHWMGIRRRSSSSASQMPIQFPNEDRDWLMVLMTTRHLPQLLALPLDRLLRRKHIQIVSIASFQITVVPKCVTQEAQTYPFFPQVHYPRLFTVDLQLEFAFQPRLE
jgi:hypothetical protein